MRTESNAYEAVRPQTVDLGRRARSLHVQGHVQMLRAREPLDDVLDVRCQLRHTLRNRERQMPELCEAALHLLYLQMQRHHYRQSRVSWLVFGGDGVRTHTFGSDQVAGTPNGNQPTQSQFAPVVLNLDGVHVFTCGMVLRRPPVYGS